MGHIRKILVPLDGSPPSIAALEYAVGFAEDTSATVDVLYVNAPDAFDIGATTSSAPAALEEAQRARKAAVDEARARLGAQLDERTEAGEPLRKILESAEAGKYDLVVMGTHGRVGRLHMLLGSVAEGVVRNAPCPVLTVREPGGEEESCAERLHRTRSVGPQTSSGR
jgi:nucleotide-binding universal stress UspA family protein